MIVLRGAERTYQLDCSTTNAFCRLEELTGRPYEVVLKELRGQRARAVTVRAFVAAALVDPPEPTTAQVGDIIDDIGGVPLIRAAVRQAHHKRGRARG